MTGVQTCALPIWVLDEITSSLMTRFVAFYDEDKKKKEWKKFHWISTSEYLCAENSKAGVASLRFKLHEHMIPFLLLLKENFASVPFIDIVRMPSAGSIRMFEILYHESLSLTKREVYLDLDDLKMRLGVDDKYHRS